MKLLEQAGAIARSDGPQAAVRFVEHAAEAGDAEGHFLVAHWLLHGTDRPRDAAAACRHLEQAASAGKAEAGRVLAHLTASGTGCEADRERALDFLQKAAPLDPVAAAELAMLPRLQEDFAAVREPVLVDPHIEIVRSLLSPEECAYLIARAGPLLKPSFVDDGRTGIGRPDPIRTSHGAAFVPHEADLIVQEITRRIAVVTGTREQHAEALYVMRYEPGQQYRPHLDSLPGLANQREWTAIAYLNDRFEGGATAFPQLGLSLRPCIGDILLFQNSDSGQKADPRMVHAGEPVTSGEKWVATRWIRHRPHDPYDRD